MCACRLLPAPPRVDGIFGLMCVRILPTLPRPPKTRVAVSQICKATPAAITNKRVEQEQQRAGEGAELQQPVDPPR